MRETELFIERPLGEELLRGAATDAERRTADSFSSQRRRKEYLMWRYIVRRELGPQTAVGYLPSGRPTVNLEGIHIGVSHCRDFVAVIISSRPCAVDIEPLSRDFSRAAERCCVPAERALSDDPRLAAALWCAKETLYKYACGEERRATDFAADIRIESVDFHNGTITGRLCGEDAVQMRMTEHEDCLVVFVG